MARPRFTYRNMADRAARAGFAMLGVCFITVGARADAVTDWNVIALNTIPPEIVGPPHARILGYIHAAVFDAANAVERKYTVYAIDVKAPDASAEAAVAAAAHGMLTRFYPVRKEPLDAALANALKAIPAGPAKTEGLVVGNAVAEHLYAASLRDHADAPAPAYTPGQSAASWRPYPPTQEPRGMTWGGITPFMLKTADQFAVPGPLPVRSSEYAKEVEEVRNLGGVASAQRSADQTAAAIFWTVSVPTVMNAISRKAATAKGTDLAANARLFALLNMAMSDASVATWQQKFEHKFLRPVMAIRNAPALENPGIQHDPVWEPLLVTPGHPDYPSGHCAAAGAGIVILQKFFETDVANASFTFPPGGATRKWATYSELAKEIGAARVWGGIHTRTADDHADALGRQVAEYQFANFLRPVR